MFLLRIGFNQKNEAICLENLLPLSKFALRSQEWLIFSTEMIGKTIQIIKSKQSKGVLNRNQKIIVSIWKWKMEYSKYEKKEIEVNDKLKKHLST